MILFFQKHFTTLLFLIIFLWIESARSALSLNILCCAFCKGKVLPWSSGQDSGSPESPRKRLPEGQPDPSLMNSSQKINGNVDQEKNHISKRKCEFLVFAFSMAIFVGFYHFGLIEEQKVTFVKRALTSEINPLSTETLGLLLILWSSFRGFSEQLLNVPVVLDAMENRTELYNSLLLSCTV